MLEAKETRVNKWGSSLGIRLPREFTDLSGLEHKSKVRIEMSNGILHVIPVVEPRQRKPLAAILAEALDSGEWDGAPAPITAEDNEWLDAPSVGAEVVPYD